MSHWLVTLLRSTELSTSRGGGPIAAHRQKQMKKGHNRLGWHTVNYVKFLSKTTCCHPCLALSVTSDARVYYWLYHVSHCRVRCPKISAIRATPQQHQVTNTMMSLTAEGPCLTVDLPHPRAGLQITAKGTYIPTGRQHE